LRRLFNSSNELDGAQYRLSAKFSSFLRNAGNFSTLSASQAAQEKNLYCMKKNTTRV